MNFDHKLFETFPIVSPDRFEMGMHGMRVPGGYVFWWSPGGGAYLQQFVPLDTIEGDPLCGRRAARQKAWNERIERGVMSVLPGETIILGENRLGGAGSADEAPGDAPSDTE